MSHADDTRPRGATGIGTPNDPHPSDPHAAYRRGELGAPQLLQLDPKLRRNPAKPDPSVEEVEQSILLTSLAKMEHWGQSNSIWPAGFGLACCAIEMMSVPSSRYDIARFGAEVFRSSPRQADLMIVSGRVSQKMAAPLRQIYDQMLEPKWVIAMGACSSSGGMFSNYAVVQGVHKIVPVDVHVPGCPPRPEQLLHGFMTLQKKIRSGEPPAYMQEVGMVDEHRPPVGGDA
jgi:NADH-quinone oxidoreductase subunit B